MYQTICFHYHLNDKSFILGDSGGADAGKPVPREGAELLERLRAASTADFVIERDGGPILTILLNPQRAFVMWMKETGDEGQHAVDPDADGSESEEFVLSNGQVDEFSAFDTVSREASLEALGHFVQTREPAPQLMWQAP